MFRGEIQSAENIIPEAFARYRKEKTRMFSSEEQMGNYLDFWLDKERGVSDYRRYARP